MWPLCEDARCTFFFISMRVLALNKLFSDTWGQKVARYMNKVRHKYFFQCCNQCNPSNSSPLDSKTHSERSNHELAPIASFQGWES